MESCSARIDVNDMIDKIEGQVFVKPYNLNPHKVDIDEWYYTVTILGVLCPWLFVNDSMLNLFGNLYLTFKYK